MSVCNLNKLLIPIHCYLSQIQRDEALPLTHEKVRKDGENFSGFLQLNFGKTYNNSKIIFLHFLQICEEEFIDTLTSVAAKVRLQHEIP
jgi:hypothetical protein